MAEEIITNASEGDPRKDAISRISQLSEKIGVEAEARKKAEEAVLLQAKEKDSLLKERDFYKNFNPLTSKYQNAAEFQDKIREKVLQGYDVEDATVAVLSREGKLNASPKIEREAVTGGSATTNVSSGGQKGLNEMNVEEKRSALIDEFKRLGIRT